MEFKSKTSIFSKKKTSLGLLATVLLAGTWLTVLEIDHPNFFTEYDNITVHLTFFVHNWNTVIEQRTLPLITFHQRLGHIYLTQGLTAVLSPIPYIAVGLSKIIYHNSFNAVEIIVFFYRLLGAACMYLLLRQLKLSPVVSSLGSLFWNTLPYFVTTGTFWLYENYALAYLPLNFLFLERLITRPRLSTALLLAIVKTWFLVEGYPEYTFMIFVFEFLYVLFVVITNINNGKRKNAVRLSSLYMLCLLVFALSSSPLVLPTLRDQALSINRSGPVPFGEFMGFYVTLETFTKTQLYSFSPQALWWASSCIYYVGFITLSFFLLLLVRRVRQNSKRHNVLLYSTLALIAYLASTSLHQYLYEVPPFYFFRRAEKYYPLFLFFVTVASTGIAATLTKNSATLGRQAVHGVLVLSIALNIFVVWSNKDTAWLIKDIRSPIETVFEYTPHEKGRVFTFTDYLANDDYTFTAHNFATLYGVYDMGGYDALRLENNSIQSLGLWYKSVYIGLPTMDTLDHLSQWSVRYLQTQNKPLIRNYADNNPQLKLIYEDQNILLYENDEALPYVYESVKPQHITPHKFGVNEINIYPTNPGPHQLTVTVIPLSNYVIYFDGERAGPPNSDTPQLIVNVPANTKNVLIRYEDQLFKLGLVLCFSTWIIIFLFLAIKRLLKKKESLFYKTPPPTKEKLNI